MVGWLIWAGTAIDRAIGNRTAATKHATADETTGAFRYPPTARNDRAVTTVGGSAYGHGAAENTENRPGQTLIWNESGSSPRSRRSVAVSRVRNIRERAPKREAHTDAGLFLG
jgi:hypothetical protein